ncbi:MAG: cobyric acid synthase [Pseudomonadota bacterium]
MFQGTGSDVGKSILVAGLARALTRRGLRVQPFKPQNMSNNAAVTVDGGEIGRAQALQARACGVAPTVHMNPVLLKPQSEIGAQVVVQGEVIGAARADEYQRMKGTLMPRVLESFARLKSQADIVLIEGAGSASEVNLRAGDIANMGFAEAADVPVVLIGDIDRGGVIASVVGTRQLLSNTERARVSGYLINKFRGDVRLFDSGIDVIGAETGWPCFGVVPWFSDAGKLPAEDALALQATPRRRSNAHIRVAILTFARIANFDDLDPLAAEPDVSVEFVKAGAVIPPDADLVILPGSKSTLADLAHCRAQGWDVDLAAHVRRGGSVLGICGGYQMLGQSVRDPDGIEGTLTELPGLGLLDVETVMAGAKTLRYTDGRHLATNAAVRGYEMHIGVTSGPGLQVPMLELDGAPHGAVSADGRVSGCYVHGLFADDRFRHAFLEALKSREVGLSHYEAEVESALDALAVHLETHTDVERMFGL